MAGKTTETSKKPVQPDSDAQSGSTGRRAPDGKQPSGADTGQGRYGQTGIADGEAHETAGQAKYRNSEKDGDPGTKQESNPGSGHAEKDETQKPKKPDANAADIPKTG